MKFTGRNRAAARRAAALAHEADQLTRLITYLAALAITAERHQP